MKPAALVPAGVLVIGALVYGAGVALTGPGARTGVAAGVAVGCAFQLLLLLIARVAFPGKHLAAYGVGMLGRLLLVVASALVLVPASGLPAAPTLFSLVTVLFATTVLEPVALAAGTEKKS
ncbi:MAG: hypothetical protein AVDCRST_MAG68-5316 [uncultured Gemmatimonadetes bacterium]|uniref:ATP synthase protein I2 n=1 Tax=uncultured Gemmatimonadota bacterium TaxID=203437 RepID=A0A6J4MUH1_9BACT|nr:MAG: hypothetical protein AVDCRST_MAG68-5316 [uncultured Gemmatimonadota bacterium]